MAERLGRAGDCAGKERKKLRCEEMAWANPNDTNVAISHGWREELLKVVVQFQRQTACLVDLPLT